MGYTCIAGIDEAGRGPLAGPVVAAAVILRDGYDNPQIRDSKKIAPHRREQLFEVIQRDAVAIGTGVVDAAVIDAINILQATLAAMVQAVGDLGMTPDYLLVDGNQCLPLTVSQETIIEGDARCLSIAAASIVAKITRDRIMAIYHRQFPQYNFLKNKGYGTREHREALAVFGPCKIHRRSFRLDGRRPETGDLFSA